MFIATCSACLYCFQALKLINSFEFMVSGSKQGNAEDSTITDDD
ncbi:hypothetical protein GXM_07464 [Nostoc sphaeroides CCNUC1]|uniref:Uncharacterized protein n=1 Tax=Nostoc sphaeroides CCNUC1 TaxID=2653204 RepID=A0A5P8WBB3_9NOSO|nr:hypothetical protein GXM_07464 [Nostoc sphaeroides CCNUC1]